MVDLARKVMVKTGHNNSLEVAEMAPNTEKLRQTVASTTGKAPPSSLSASSSENSAETITNDGNQEDDALKVQDILKWKFSESSLAAAIQLQIEKQKTKQEQLKLANLEKILKILDLAIQYNIPKESIILLFSDLSQFSTPEISQRLNKYSKQKPAEFVEPSSNQNSISKNASSMTTNTNSITNTNTITKTKLKPYTHTKGSQSLGSAANKATTSVFKVNLPQTVQYQFHHWLGPSSSSSKSSRKTDFDDESTRKQRKTSISDASGNTNLSKVDDTSFLASANTSIIANSSLLFNNSQNNSILSPTGETSAGNDSLMIPPAPVLKQNSLTNRGSPMRRNYHRRGLSESIIQKQPSFQSQTQQHVLIPPAHHFVHVNAGPALPISTVTPNTPTRRRPSSQHSRQASIDGFSVQKNFVFPTNNNIAASNYPVTYSPPQYTSNQFSPNRFLTLSPPTIQNVSNVSTYSPTRKLQQASYLNPPASSGSQDGIVKGHQKTHSKIDLNFMLSHQGSNSNNDNNNTGAPTE